MSAATKPKKPRSTKKSKSELEAKIAELEAKLNQLSSQVKPAEVRATPPPAKAPPKPKEVQKPAPSSGEVAPAYATISSTGYTGNRYYATRARLAYHPPDKQFRGASQTVTVQTSPPAPEPQQEPQTYQESKQRTEHKKPSRSSETKPTPPPKPKEAPKPAPSSGEVAPAYATTSSTGYTGNRYYATRARLSYHPPDKQFKGEAQATVQAAPEPPKPKRGTLPAGLKP